MKLTKGMRVIAINDVGAEFTGYLVNINDYRPPEMKYCVDLDIGELVFVGENSIRTIEKGGAE